MKIFKAFQHRSDDKKWLTKKVMKAAEDKIFEGTPYLRQIEKLKDHGRQETPRYTLLLCNESVRMRAQWSGCIKY